MNKSKFIRGIIGVTTSAAAVFSAFSPLAPISAAAEDNAETTVSVNTEDLPDKLMNGSFEWPKVETFVGDLNNASNTYTDTTNSSHNIQTGDGQEISFTNGMPWLVTTVDLFEDAVKKEDAENTSQQNGQFYWKTTAHDQRIELETDNVGVGDANTGMTKFWGQDCGDNWGAREGNQFAELVAEERASLYQNIKTEPGSVLTWSLDHRGRKTSNGTGVDTMALFIGPAQKGSINKTSSGTDSQDLFIAMVEQLYPNYAEEQSGNTPIERTFYAKPITDASSDIVVSQSRTNVCTDEWKCWIITDNNTNWVTRSGSYTVPDGQTATTFAFTPLTATNNWSDTYNQGNCLDNIRFSKQYPLIVTAMDGVTGTINGGGISNVTAEHTQEYAGSAEANSSVKIQIAPVHKTYKFVGAIVNGTYIKPEDEKYFTPNGDGSYILNLTMDESKNVHLMCSAVGEVHYDANGGTLPADMDSIYLFTKDDQTYTISNPPVYPGSIFVHWEVYASDGKTSYNATVGEKHTVTYDSTNHTFTITDEDNVTQNFTIPNNADKYAIVLRAVYDHTVEVQACTRHIGYENDCGDSSGGTVTVTKGGTEDSGGSKVTIKSGESFTATAVPNEGYAVESWWFSYEETPGGGEWTELEQIPNAGDKESYTATFRGDRNVKIHVHFTEIPTSPYLAAVAQDDAAKEALTNAGITNIGTVAQPGSGSVYDNGADGGNKYGNTIATGFFVTRDFGTDATKLSGVWTINVPVEGTFIKVHDADIDANGSPDPTIYPHLVGREAIITDDNVATGSGSIYSAKPQSGENNNKQYRFYTESNTTVSGGGSAVFGIVIDDLYAPGAIAGFRQYDTKPDDVKGELTAGNSVNADKKDPYNQSELDALYDNANNE